jgi:hypothetical protein
MLAYTKEATTQVGVEKKLIAPTPGTLGSKNQADP